MNDEDLVLLGCSLFKILFIKHDLGQQSFRALSLDYNNIPILDE